MAVVADHPGSPEGMGILGEAPRPENELVSAVAAVDDRFLLHEEPVVSTGAQPDVGGPLGQLSSVWSGTHRR